MSSKRHKPEVIVAKLRHHGNAVSDMSALDHKQT